MVAKNVDVFSTYSGSIVFGLPTYERLNANQRLAVLAHEFAHLKQRDSIKHLQRHVLPSVCLWAFALVVSYAAFGLSRYTEIILFVGLPIALSYLPFFFQLADAKNSREGEIRCDRIAASYVGPEDLLSALSLIDATVATTREGSFMYGLLNRLYPTMQERQRLILNLS
jgi:Zn-dependent protease with chaperone function